MSVGCVSACFVVRSVDGVGVRSRAGGVLGALGGARRAVEFLRHGDRGIHAADEQRMFGSALNL